MNKNITPDEEVVEKLYASLANVISGHESECVYFTLSMLLATVAHLEGFTKQEFMNKMEFVWNSTASESEFTLHQVH